MRDEKLLISLATRGNDIYDGTLMFIMKQTYRFNQINLALFRSGWKPRQEELFQDAAERDIDYLFILDTDVAPKWDTIEQLIDTGQKLIVAPIWMYQPEGNDIHLNVNREGKERTRVPSEKGIERIKTSSFAACLIHKTVLKAFTEAGEAFTEWSPLLDVQFKNYLSDFIFFQKALALGFQPFVDWNLTPGCHHRYVQLSDKTLWGFFTRTVADISEQKEEGTLCQTL